MRSEDQFLARIMRAVSSVRGRECSDLRLGIGDDGAILAPGGRTHWVLSCDAFLEGVHFVSKLHAADSVGYKSLVRAASDLAAMGAKPRFFLLALALPANRTGVWLDQFLQGIVRAARRLGMVLIGGDTTKSPRVSINITVVGETAPGVALKRTGAHPGDVLYVAGKLGSAQLGLELVMAGLGRKRRFAKLIRHHLYPELHLDLGAWLASHRIASAMIDISDGLSTDLFRLCAASRVGARVDADRIPRVTIPSGLSQQVKHLRLDPEQMALHGGDDYTLLFTVPKRKLSRLRGAPEFSKLTPIGEITRAKQIGLLSADGSYKRLVPAGWDPFKRN